MTRAEQEERLALQTEYARTHSRFYREAHAFTSAEDIRREPESFLCVSPKQIARVITLKSSGSTQSPKRLFFTEADLMKTEDFFFHGMQPLVRPGETATVFMEGASAYSVGGLLKSALARFGAGVRTAGFLHGESPSPGAAEGAACLIGTPAELALLAGRYPRLRPRTVLLSGERVPRSLRARLERVWGAETFVHWGMCETGYGGAVEGADHNGLLIRNGSLLMETVDPISGAALPAGESGELVFSTLDREGMPLLRYRTGDFGRLIPVPGALPRLDPAVERLSERAFLPDGAVFSPLAVDELAFSCDGVTDCRALLTGETLSVTVRGACPELGERLRALWPALSVSVQQTDGPLPFGHGKRL